jgi:hypothetical protein
MCQLRRSHPLHRATDQRLSHRVRLIEPARPVEQRIYSGRRRPAVFVDWRAQAPIQCVAPTPRKAPATNAVVAAATICLFSAGPLSPCSLRAQGGTIHQHAGDGGSGSGVRSQVNSFSALSCTDIVPSGKVL